MSQFHSLFRKVVADREVVPQRQAEDTLDSPDKDYVLRPVPVVQARVAPASQFVFHLDPQSVGAERFRLLRMRLQEPWKAGKLKRLLITSPLPHDGKSTVAINLATALSEHGKKSVLLIDGDLHHPQLVDFLGIAPPPAGLSECLSQKMDPLAVIRRIEPFGWYLLSAGTPRTNATELLQTTIIGDVLQNVAHYFDWLLIDSPPVIPVTDALALRQQADASLLIVRAATTTREELTEAVTLIGKQHILGIVLNGVEGLHRLYSRYGYYRS